MNREARAAFALIGLLLLTVGIYMLNNGILVSTQLHLVSHRDPQSNRIINEPVRVCRYLHLTGIADYRTSGREVADAADGLASCRFHRKPSER
jgi:hypothetical protein